MHVWFFIISFSSFNFLLGKSHALLGSGLTVWPGTEMPCMCHTVHVPKGVQACPAPAAGLPVWLIWRPSALRVCPRHYQLLVWWEQGLRGPPEACGAFGICCWLRSWGFLPFFRSSASPFRLPCLVFALATFFNKLSPSEKVFVIIMGSRIQFPRLSEKYSHHESSSVSGYGAGMLSDTVFCITSVVFQCVISNSILVLHCIVYAHNILHLLETLSETCTKSSYWCASVCRFRGRGVYLCSGFIPFRMLSA